MRIGEWTVDATCDRIARGDDSRKLERRAMAVLVHLANTPGQVVSKDALIDAVWNGNAVSDHSVAIVISDLRKALGDDRREARYIETIPKRGYRLIATVSHGRTGAAEDERRPLRRLRFAALAVVPALALGAIAVATARGDEPPPPTLIVTDVRDESGSPAGRRLAFALPELLIVNLGQYPRGPLIRLRGTDDPGLAESTERAVLSGRIVRDGASLAVFASLKRVEDGRVLWSDSYPISDATLATHARDIAGSAAVALGADLQPPPVEAGATPRSQALYWEARQLAETRDEPGLRAARSKLVEALRESPRFASAHAALANIYAHKSGEHLGLPRLDTFAAADRHLRIAEQLAPPTAETSVTRALVAIFRDEDKGVALRHARLAVTTAPSNADAWQSLAMVSSVRGDDRTALDAISRAIAIEPTRRDLKSDRVWMLYVAGRANEARAAAAQIRDPGTVMLMYRALIETRRGDKAAAFEHWVERARKRGLEASEIEAATKLRDTDLDRAYRRLADAVADTAVYEENAVALAAMYRAGGEQDKANDVLTGIRRNRDNWVWLWLDRLPELRQA